MKAITILKMTTSVSPVALSTPSHIIDPFSAQVPRGRELLCLCRNPEQALGDLCLLYHVFNGEAVLETELSGLPTAFDWRHGENSGTLVW